ncbi:MAG: phosphoglycerate kinase, partial [Saprospiraceae bacterium]|nr:phosphoglycerate kinase [Saprospiraceae bacterium]
AFGTAHRAHASTAIIASYFPPENRAFGLLMDAELANAARTMDHPERPLVAIVGGAKVSDKILLLENLLEKVDGLIVGGGMAYTFIKAQGGSIGQSLVEDDLLDLARQLIEKARAKHVRFLLPPDSLIADRFAPDAETRIVPTAEIPDGWMGLDIGPEAIASFRAMILEARTILWNGPMGVFEMPAFATGTLQVAQALAEATAGGAFSLVGGGDSVTAVNQMGLADQVSFVSTGGGAMLELLEGKTLPGVAAIRDQDLPAKD